jgi:hypothetical protein
LPNNVPTGTKFLPYPPPYRVKPVGYSGFGYPLPSLAAMMELPAGSGSSRNQKRTGRPDTRNVSRDPFLATARHPAAAPVGSGASAPPLRTCSLKTQKPGRTCVAVVPTDTTLVPSRGNKRRPALDRRAAARPPAATAPPPQGRTHGRGGHARTRVPGPAPKQPVRLGRNRLGWTSGGQPAVRWADFQPFGSLVRWSRVYNQPRRLP